MQMTLNDKELPLEIMILSAYNEYRENGYPADPKVYQIRGNSRTVDDICDYIDDVAHIPNIYIGVDEDKLILEPWEFNIVTDNRLGLGEIVFGPEQIELKWTSKE